MGRYGKELGALKQDPAGPYLDGARKKRKEGLAKSSGPWRLAASGTGASIGRATLANTSMEVAWPTICLSEVASETGTSNEAAADKLLRSLLVGHRLAFKGLGKSDRAMIHDLAHKVPGLWKQSYADPNSGNGARMVCVERVAQLPVKALDASQPKDLSLTPCSGPEGAFETQHSDSGRSCSVPTAASLPRKGRWRRSQTQATVEPLQGSSSTHHVPIQSIEKAEAVTEVMPQACSQHEARAVASTSSSALFGSVCIVWLRDDMRSRDNPALLRAAEGGFDLVVPVYIHDEERWNPDRLKGAARMWKHESLRAFASQLGSLGSRLVLRRVEHGSVACELLNLLAELDPDCTHSSKPERLVVFNRRYHPHQHAHDEEVIAKLKAAGIAVETFVGNVLYEPCTLQPIERWQRWRARVRAEEAKARGLEAGSLEAGQALSGRPKALEHVSGFGSYRFFSHALEELGPPRPPCAAVQRLPPCPTLVSVSLAELGLGNTTGYGFPPDFRQFSADASGKSANGKSSASKGAACDWAAEMKRWWTFGEAAALHRLEEFLNKVLASGDFEGRKRLLANCKNTSEISPYIRFGELSAKTVYWAAKQRRERTSQKLFENPDYEYVGRHGRTFKGNPNEDAKANSTFLRRFVWRDLAYWFLWEFPTLPTTSMRIQYEQEVWAGTRKQLRNWQRGNTGFPLVDAAMRQLWAVGWIPNYLRHVVAQMLIEYLDLSWKHGLQWFEYTLVDMDTAINSLMWQNGGHSGPDHWEFVLHPINAAKSCDPDGAYVRRWLPFLADCPLEFIHRPWDLPVRIFKLPSLGIYPDRPILADLDEARRDHLRRVLEVRRNHPEMISRTGHEWLKLPGRSGLLAKCVTRLEFRAETEDFLLYQAPRHKYNAPPRKANLSRSNDECGRILNEIVNAHQTEDSYGPVL